MWQRALAAVVAVLSGVGILVGAAQGVVGMFEPGGPVAFKEGVVREIKTRTITADRFVQMLVDADGTALMLDPRSS